MLQHMSLIKWNNFLHIIKHYRYTTLREAIVERSNCTLKEILNNQKWVTKTPRDWLYSTLLTLNFKMLVNINKKTYSCWETLGYRKYWWTKTACFKGLLTLEWKTGNVLGEGIYLYSHRGKSSSRSKLVETRWGRPSWGSQSQKRK